jgi:hypothetical protein
MGTTSQVLPGRADDALVVRDPDSLRAWRKQLRTAVANRNLPLVRFDFPALPLEQNRTLSAFANSYRNACGCTSAGFFMTAAIAASAVWYFAFGGQLGAIGIAEIVSLAGIAFLALLAGKAWGLLWARWRLLRIAAGLPGAIGGADRNAIS